ncbi:MAG TPA: hypothetical protein VEK38_02980 [Candidatus Bathyarchaeia archaeon]|nr:hypothetical protein [Candidatus Bathyarchaeia archaeon]
MELTEYGIYDIYGMVHVPWWQTPLFFIACIVSGMIILAGIIMLCIIIRRRYKKKEVIPYWQQAVLELEEAEKAFIDGNMSAMLLYETLVRITKKYLHTRFSCDVLGKTDSELADYIHNLDIIEEQKNQLTALCQLSASIKFYPAALAHDYAQKDCQALVAFIRATHIALPS